VGRAAEHQNGQICVARVRMTVSNIGAACHDTRKLAPAPAFTDELRKGVERGTTRGNNEPMLKTIQDYGNAVTEARHGQATRPLQRSLSAMRR
jgi:hypothetical protein